MGDLTQGAIDKEAADAARNKAFVSGQAATPAQDAPRGSVQGTAPASSAPLTPKVSGENEQHFTSMVNGLRHLFGIKDGAEPSPNGGMSREAGAVNAMNDALKP